MESKRVLYLQAEYLNKQTKRVISYIYDNRIELDIYDNQIEVIIKIWKGQLTQAEGELESVFINVSIPIPREAG